MKKLFTTAFVISIASVMFWLFRYVDRSQIDNSSTFIYGYGSTIVTVLVALFYYSKGIKFSVKESLIVGFLTFIFWVLLQHIAGLIWLIGKIGFWQAVSIGGLPGIYFFVTAGAFLAPLFILKTAGLLFGPGYSQLIITDLVYIIFVASVLYFIPRFRKV